MLKITCMRCSQVCHVLRNNLLWRHWAGAKIARGISGSCGLGVPISPKRYPKSLSQAQQLISWALRDWNWTSWALKVEAWCGGCFKKLSQGGFTWLHHAHFGLPWVGWQQHVLPQSGRPCAMRLVSTSGLQQPYFCGSTTTDDMVLLSNHHGAPVGKRNVCRIWSNKAMQNIHSQVVLGGMRILPRTSLGWKCNVSLVTLTWQPLPVYNANVKTTV